MRRICGARGMQKLDEAKVRTIRAEAKYWPLRALARRFGVREEEISRIINRRTWAGVS